MKKQLRHKVAILGGSFNPPTKGHVKIAELVLENNLVDKIWLLPCFNHNLGKFSTDPLHRIEMCYKPIKGKKNVEVCQYEILSESDGRMFETMEHLLEVNPHTDFSIIIGMDCALQIANWFNWKELIQLVPFIVIDRIGGWSQQTDIMAKHWFDLPPHILVRSNFKHDYSSTLARKAIEKNDNESQERLISRKVIDYIKANGLYL